MKLLFFAMMATVFLSCNSSPSTSDKPVRVLDDLTAEDEVDDCPNDYIDAVADLYNKRTLARNYYVKFTQGNRLYTPKLVSQTFTNIYDDNIEFVSKYIENDDSRIVTCLAVLDNKEIIINSNNFARENYKIVEKYKAEITKCSNQRNKCAHDKDLIKMN